MNLRLCAANLSILGVMAGPSHAPTMGFRSSTVRMSTLYLGGEDLLNVDVVDGSLFRVGDRQALNTRAANEMLIEVIGFIFSALKCNYRIS